MARCYWPARSWNQEAFTEALWSVFCNDVLPRRPGLPLFPDLCSRLIFLSLKYSDVSSVEYISIPIFHTQYLHVC